MITITLVEYKNHRFRLSSSFFSFSDLTTYQVKNILSNMFCDECFRHTPFKKFKSGFEFDLGGIIYINSKEN